MPSKHSGAAGNNNKLRMKSGSGCDREMICRIEIS
jgi:hypothetical protein